MATLAAQLHGSRRGWLLSARVDIACFWLPLAVGLLALAAYRNSVVSSSAFLSFLLLQGLGLAPFHSGATWFHFLDDSIRDQFFGTTTSRLKSMFGMAAIIIVFMGGYVLAPTFVICAYVIWTIQHIVQQNVGILLLYQNQGGEQVVLDRQSAVSSLQSAGWFFSFLFLTHYAEPYSWQQFALFACIACSVFQTAAAVKTGLRGVREQLRAGKSSNLPMLGFWMVALLFLLPCALVSKNYNEALLIPFVMHWFQYIGLNFVIAQRKGVAENSMLQNLGVLALVSCLVTAIIIGAGGIAAVYLPLSSVKAKLLTGFVLAVSSLHYAQDALIWRFKNPVMRDRLLRFLKQPSSLQQISLFQQTSSPQQTNLIGSSSPIHVNELEQPTSLRQAGKVSVSSQR